MLISLIIPHFKNLSGLEKLLLSIPIKSTIEVLIVNDSPNTDSIDEIYKVIPTGMNVRVCINDSGFAGAGSCRNIGISKAKGKWLLFSDDDDYFESDAFSIIQHWLSIHSDKDIIYFTPTSRDSEGHLSDRHIRYKNQVRDVLYKHADESLVRVGFKVPWSKLISRAFVIENNILFDQVIASNDIMFSVKSGLAARDIALVDEVIYCVTRGENSLTINTSTEVMESRLDVAISYSCYLGRKSEYSTSLISLIYNYWRYVGVNKKLKLLKSFMLGELRFFPNNLILAIKKYFEDSRSSLVNYRKK